MSRTNRGEKGDGYEYWSRRFAGYHLDPGPYNKKRTNRHERRQAKDKCRRGVTEGDGLEPDDEEYPETD